MNNRLQVMRIHMLLAAFLLPSAILYVVSGALYTLDIKGDIGKQEIILRLGQPFTPDIEWLTQVTKSALTERELPWPDGEPTLRSRRGSYELRWGDLAHVVTVVPGSDPRSVALTFKERSPLARIMRIHRAEAGTMFKVLSVLLAMGLVILFVTGLHMVRSVPRLRRPVMLSVACGLAIFLALLV